MEIPWKYIRFRGCTPSPTHDPQVVASDHPGAELARAAGDLVLVIDDQSVVAGGHRLGCALERDELIAEIDERHPAGPTPQLEAVDELAEELDHLFEAGPNLAGVAG